MASVLNKLNLNGIEYNIATSAYAVCSDIADHSSKSVSLEGFTLTTGVTIHVKFTNGIYAWQPTLNVNNTGAKRILCPSFVSSADDLNQAVEICVPGEVVALTYDGTYWQVNKSNVSSYIVDLLQKLDTMKNTILRFQEVNPDLPVPTEEVLSLHFCGTTETENIAGPEGGIYKLSKGGCSAYRKYSDTSLSAARTGSSGYSMNGGMSMTSTSGSIFYYNYTSMAMRFDPSCLGQAMTITGIDLYFTKDPGSYGNNPTVYGNEGGDWIPTAQADEQFAQNICNAEYGEYTYADGNTNFTCYKMHIPFTDPKYYSGNDCLNLLIEWQPGSYISGIDMHNLITFHYTTSLVSPFQS